MTALLLLLAIIGGIVVGDVVLENTTADDITILNHTISGYSEGLLLAMAATLGVVLGLLMVASVGSSRPRRARRKQLRTAAGDLNRQVAQFKRENARLRDEVARRVQPVGHLGELASPADLGSTRRAGSTADRVTVPSRQVAERHSEPLYEEAKRAARLRSDPDLSFPSADDRARFWQTDHYVRRS